MSRKETFRRRIVIALAAVLFGGALAPRAQRIDPGVPVPNLIVVTNAHDAGAGSLRQAMLSANANPDPDTITFAIPGPGPFVIALQTPLPAVSNPVVIDGLTQTGATTQAPQVFLDGVAMQRGRSRGQAPGFEILTGRTTIRGMGIGHFPGPGVYIAPSADGNRIEGCVIAGNTGDGILIIGGSRSTVSDNRIGTTADGLAALPNGGNGVTLSDGASGTTLESNLISGNGGWGIDLQAGGTRAPVSATRIRSNVIGLSLNSAVLDRSAASDAYMGLGGTGDYGPKRRGNLGGGIRATNSDGTIIGPGNVISGNTQHGIALEGSGKTAPVIQGNLIGTDATGSVARGNVLDGIRAAAANTRVGGRIAGEGNVISGNLKDGLEILSNGVTVEGNYIGTDITGMMDVGNGPMLDISLGGWNSGVAIDGSSGITVGSSDPAGRNLISGNTVGLVARKSDRLRVEGNYIGTNKDLSGHLPNGLGSGAGGIALYGGSGASILSNNISGNTGVGGGIYTGNGPVGAKVAENTISHNTGPGINVRGGDGVNGDPVANITITENAIFGNTGIGIDLGGDGPTPSAQNYPVVIAVTNGRTTSMDFRLDGSAGTYTIEFFSGASCGAAEKMVTGTSEGIGRHRVDLGSLLPIGTWVVATATDAAGNTSELSACGQVRPGPAYTWWMSQGPGEVTTTSLGRENGVAQFTYQLTGDKEKKLPDGSFSGEWRFTTVATAAAVISLDWSWTGFHAYTARLEVFVNHQGQDVSVIQLVDAGPADCCSSSSGEFAYNGTTSVVVDSGDTYGFRLRGAHSDSVKALRGTFDVTVGIDGSTSLFASVRDTPIRARRQGPDRRDGVRKVYR